MTSNNQRRIGVSFPVAQVSLESAYRKNVCLGTAVGPHPDWGSKL